MTTESKAAFDSKAALGITPSQTIGPFFAYALTPRAYGGSELATEQVAADGVAGARIRVEGIVYDGDGAVVSDAMIEIWQADAQGRFNASGNAGFTGFGRAETTAEGGFHFDTILPGALPGPGGRMQAPHLTVSVFARGLLVRLATRIYFEGEPGNADDPVLALVPADRRNTLIAKQQGQGIFRFDIRLQGEGETVFFEA
jgi:protocatechuate 3,4-dioxygenase alpha subunit